MNKAIIIGRLTRDPDIRWSDTSSGKSCVARYTLAVDRPKREDGEKSADFISCVSFGKTAEFAEKYLAKGVKIAVIGRIQTGSYTNKDGVKVYTTDIVVENHEFCESKRINDQTRTSGMSAEPDPDQSGNDAFYDIPEEMNLPFR